DLFNPALPASLPACSSGVSRLLRDKPHPEHRRPVLSGDQELVGTGDRGDAVQYVFAGRLQLGAQLSRVDHAGDTPGRGLDAEDGVGLPDVRVDRVADTHSSSLSWS